MVGSLNRQSPTPAERMETLQVMKTTESAVSLPKVFIPTEGEIALAEELGRGRVSAKPKSIRNNRSGFHGENDDRAYPHILGAMMEIAYSRITGKRLDERLLAGGDKCDFDGVETKSSTWVGPDIELKVDQCEYIRKLPVAYCLGRVSKRYDFVEFIGSISRERFDIIKSPRQHKYTPNWVVKAKDLCPVIVVVSDGARRLHPLEA